MAKKYFAFLLFLLCIISCDYKIKQTEDIDEDKISIEVERYDRIQSRYLTTGDFSALQQMSTGYPMETRILIEDILGIGQVDDADINTKLLNFFQDTIAQSLIIETETQYAKLDDINSQLTSAFHQLKKMFPDIEIPTFYAQISALRQSIIVSDDAVGISLDKYLGEDYPLYLHYYSQEQRATMNRKNILPDCLTFFLISKFPLSNFEMRTQQQRDNHLAKIQWIVNKAMGKTFFDSEYVKKINQTLSKKKNTNLYEFLKDTLTI